jgi:ABC-2 type transport system ATP-binding protein
MTPPIIAEGLTKRFGLVEALTDLDLVVEAGEIFGFLGPNGAGKTTTIRLVLDVLRPTSGRVGVLGGSGADPAVRARIGYLPADLHLDPNATAAEHLDFTDAVRGRVDRARREQLLERFDLDPTRTVRELSTGNRRKVGIVLAMAHAPELLVLDEPTSGLDPLLQHQFHLAILEAVSEGATVFLSSHVLPEVELLARRVGILRAGRLVTTAAVNDLRSQARQRLVLIAPEARPEDFAGVRGVVSASGEPGTVQIEVDGSIDAVVKAASRFEVQRIVSHDNDLEATFLDLYQDDER